MLTKATLMVALVVVPDWIPLLVPVLVVEDEVVEEGISGAWSTNCCLCLSQTSSTVVVIFYGLVSSDEYCLNIKAANRRLY